MCAAARESVGVGPSDERSDGGTPERVATVELGRISPKKIIVVVPPDPPPVRSFGATTWFIGGALIAGGVGGYMLGYAHRMTAPERSSSVAEAEHAIPAKEPVAPREPARAPIASAQASQRHLDASEITFLMKGGTDLMAHGDIVAARKMFQRAAEADDATAAFALAETYDPLVLKKLATTGFMSDTTLAHQWYEKAKELGSTAAPGRLVGVTR